MDRFCEFIWDLNIKLPKKVKNLLKKNDFKKLNNYKSFEQLDKDFDFCDKLYDVYLDDIIHLFKHYPRLDIKHEGGDEWVYEGGIYITECYSLIGYYFYITAEGEIFGFYDKDEAIDASFFLE